MAAKRNDRGPQGRPAKGSLSESAPFLLVWGEDEFLVKERAAQVYGAWRAAVGGEDHEIIDAAAANSHEALKAIGRLRLALQTLPFFGDSKIVWFRNCNFLGDDRTASSQAVTAATAELAAELKAFGWDKVRLLISAGKVDRRKVFYKTAEKLGVVEGYAGLSREDKDWVERAEAWVCERLERLGKEIDRDALAELVNAIGPELRQLDGEAEKLALFAGAARRIRLSDVQAVSARNRHARAFALADALAERDQPRLLRALADELWELRLDRQKSEIGLLYGILSKVRTLILVQELIRAGYLSGADDYGRVAAELKRIPPEAVPADRRFNPLAQHPYVLSRAVAQAGAYRTEELIRALDLLLECNGKLVGSDLDAGLLLQQTLMRIAAPSGGLDARSAQSHINGVGR